MGQAHLRFHLYLGILRCESFVRSAEGLSEGAPHFVPYVEIYRWNEVRSVSVPRLTPEVVHWGRNKNRGQEYVDLADVPEKTPSPVPGVGMRGERRTEEFQEKLTKYSWYDGAVLQD